MDNTQDVPRPDSPGSRPDQSSSGPARDTAGSTAPLPVTGSATPPGAGPTPPAGSPTPPGAGPTPPAGSAPLGGTAPPPSGGGTPPPPPPSPPPSPPPAPPPGWGPDTSDRLAARLRALRRSRNDRVLAGVCGGVSRGLGIDPLLLRVLVVVLTIFGGAGVVLYALGWLLLPVDDGEPSLGAQLAHRHTARPSSQTVLLAVVLAAAVTLGVVSAFRSWDGTLLLSLAAVGFVVYLLRQPAPPTAVMGGVPASGAAPGVGVAGAAGASGSGSTAAGSTPAGPAGGSRAPATATAVPPWQGPPGQPPTPAQPPVPPPPAPPRERSMLFGLTVSAVLLALGVLAAVDVSGADLPHGVYPATALTVVGLGLLVGAWRGRSRGLVVVGIVLAVMTLGAALTSPWQDRFERNRGVDLDLRPTSVSELPASAEYSAGQVRYDLTAVPFEGQSARLGAEIGFGEIVVTVPRTVDVTVHARTGVGAVDLLDAGSRGGFGTERTITDVGPDGPGGGTLDLNLQAGFGHLEVRRAQA